MATLSIVCAVGETAAQAVGIPVAASLINEIVKACEEVGKQKKSAKLLGKKCQELAAILTAEADKLQNEEMRKRIDEVTAVLYTVQKRMQKWAKRPLWYQWWHRNEIGAGIDQFKSEIETHLEKFSMQNQIAIKRAQDDAAVMANQNHAENREMLLTLLADHNQVLKIVERHLAGETIAREVIEEGEKELQELGKVLGPSRSPSEVDSGSQSPHHNPSSSQTTRERYLELQKHLIDLHIRTGILPADQRLDGQITKHGDIAVTGGPHTDIWKGDWLGQTQVALKSLRYVRSGDDKAQKRFIRQIEIWSKLKSKHILQFYGFVTDIGSNLHVVTPWLENGNVLEYLTRHQDADKMQLILGAAEGVRYLHSVEVVHGNLKCRNILVTDSGQACISDFGMAKTLEDITKTPMSTTLKDHDGARWMAPEVIEDESPSKASDAYSFAMSILEMLTEKPPLYEHKRDLTIIRIMAMEGPIRPKRPMAPEVMHWLTNEVWELLERCWTIEPAARPTMEDLMLDLKEISSPLTMVL